MTALRLIADDLTGALDSAAPFAAAAHTPVQVALAGPPAGHGAFDADTREATRDAARHAAASAASWLAAGRPAFRKLDSLWRGHPAAEIATSLATGFFATAIVAPAFPAQGRLTRDGRLCLSDGSAGLDLAASLAAEGLAPLRAAPGQRPDSPGMWLCDATTEAHLSMLAGARPPGPVIWVGSGGLARALAGAPGAPPALPAGPLLLLCGSRHAAARTTLASLPAGATRAPATATEAAQAAAWAIARLAAGKPAALTLEAAGAAPGAVWRHLAEALARHPMPPLLAVIGGRSLRGLCEALGVRALAVLGEARPGVPLSRLVGGTWDGVALLSRSGAFDDGGLFHSIAHGESVTA